MAGSRECPSNLRNGLSNQAPQQCCSTCGLSENSGPANRSLRFRRIRPRGPFQMKGEPMAITSTPSDEAYRHVRADAQFLRKRRLHRDQSAARRERAREADGSDQSLFEDFDDNEHGRGPMARRRDRANTGHVLFDVLYADGSRTSNRKVPGTLLGGLDGDEPARQEIEDQDRKIAQRSGRPRAEIKSISRSRKS